MNDYKLSLSNFKSFKNLDDFEILPLTIIVGKNSSGKSSILHSLLLLKQTLNSKYRESRLKLEGQYLEYSNLREMTFGLPALKDCRIGYKFDIKYRNEDSKIEFSFKSKTKGDHQEVVMDSFTQQYKKGRKVESINYLNLNQKETKSYIKNRLPGWGNSEGFKTKFEHFLPGYFESTSISKDIWKLDIPISLVHSKFSMDIDHLKDFIRDIRYLSPIRAAPKRAYVHYSDQVQELNDDGSNSAHILWSKRNEIVKWKKRNYKLITAINKCIDQIGLLQNLSPARIKEILYQVRVQESITNEYISLVDVGFGYSQVLPAILLGLLSSSNQLMLIEQPELHLHPASAANLADLFLGFIEDDKKFIIETHSQDFINRLRLRVIENPKLTSKINIVFVKFDDDTGACIKQFRIDENGMFPEWPDGFLDESEKVAEAILKARINKAQNE